MHPQNQIRAADSVKLGISAKSSDIHAAQDAQAIDAPRYLSARRSKFDLTRTAASLLYDQGKQPAEQHRTCWCHRGTPQAREAVPVFRRQDGSAARLHGVITCGSVWACPVCSARVAEFRREELETMLKRAIERCLGVYLMTLTFPHERTDKLPDLLAAKAHALVIFKRGRAYREMKDRYHRKGNVRSVEITYGENGWHPHTHDLIVADPGMELDGALVDRLRRAWLDALTKAGLLTAAKWSWAWKYAFDLRGGQYAVEYVSKFGRDAKWGITREITKGHAKVGMRSILGNEGHVTPFQVLAWAHAGDAEACHLFREYAAALEGKRMLYWSPKLKHEFEIGEREDEDLAAADRPDEARVGSITVDQLGRLHAHRALGEFIELAARHCLHDDDTANQREIEDILDCLTAGPAPSRGLVKIKRYKAPGFNVYDPSRAIGDAARFVN